MRINLPPKPPKPAAFNDDDEYTHRENIDLQFNVGQQTVSSGQNLNYDATAPVRYPDAPRPGLNITSIDPLQEMIDSTIFESQHQLSELHEPNTLQQSKNDLLAEQLSK